MSEPLEIASMLPGNHGPAGPAQVSLQRVRSTTVWNAQGDAGNAAFVQQARALWGIADLPGINRSIRSPTFTVLWIGPRSWLVFGNVPRDAAQQPQGLESTRTLLNQAGAALFDVSASRVGWTLRGPRSRDVLASGCPLDLHDNAFAPDSCAQSLFGHVAALYHRESDGAFTLHVARSFADEVWHMLCSTASQYGYQVLPEPG